MEAPAAAFRDTYIRQLYTGLYLLCNLIATPILLAIDLNSGLYRSLP